MVTARKKVIIWLTWLVVVVPGLFFTYYFFPPIQSPLHIHLLGFLILTCFVASTPMIINNTPVFFIQWVSLTLFLAFGLFIEMLFMQLAIAVLFIRLRLTRDSIYRFPLNWLLFFFVSLLSGFLYHLLGGEHGIDILANSSYFLLAVLYAFVYFLLNQIFIYFISNNVLNKRRIFFDKAFVWEALTTILTFPVGFILYILYREVGIIAVIFLGIPFASLSLILNLYHASEKVNKYLQQAGEIGHQLTQRLHEKEVMDTFLERITEIVPHDYSYIFDVVDGKELHLIKKISFGIVRKTLVKPLMIKEGISGSVLASGKAVLFRSKKEWKKLSVGDIPESVESLICVPVVRNQNVVGIFILASKQKRAYEKSQLMIVDLLSSYFAVAIENARNYEKTKSNSERCALTNLYNYRYMEELLRQEYIQLVSGERKHLSVILLDIDHFKKVNDTFGHQSGNEILCQLAERLVDIIGESGIVTRFGGEEFLIILPNVSKDSALAIAEFVREAIAQRTFILSQHINEEQNEVCINITASIGVATAPDDADDEMSLIRHADRALYVGAKRNGRNKVAQYMK